MVPVTISAQKLLKPSIDKFTNDTVRSTTQVRFATVSGYLDIRVQFLTASVSAINNDVQLDLEVDIRKETYKFFRINKGSNTLLKLADNTIVKLSNVKDMDSQEHGFGGGIMAATPCWATVMNYSLSKEDIQKLLSSNVTAVRVEADNQTFDFDIKPKDGDLIKKMLLLIAQR